METTRELSPNLAKAIIGVMNDVKNIEKSMTVGSGGSAYKGVSDKDVKNIVGNAMAKHGLCIMPIDVQENTQIDRWEEVDSYSNTTPKAMKTKQSIFTRVTTKYLLLHESGESTTLSGYGHGTDSQDKSAGKATTYALKNTLLYTFMIPTGEIDDADKTHSDDIPVPQVTKKTESQKVATPVKTQVVTPSTPTVHPELLPGTPEWKTCVDGIAEGIATVTQIRKKRILSVDNEKLITKEAETLKQELAKKLKPQLA